MSEIFRYRYQTIDKNVQSGDFQGLVSNTTHFKQHFVHFLSFSSIKMCSNVSYNFIASQSPEAPTHTVI